MKILYLIGNGFDINLGLNTKFTDFYEEYRKSQSKNEKIKKLKEEIRDYETWADLEIAFGKYTSQIASTDIFYNLFVDIEDNLAEYLKIEEKKIDKYKVNDNKFKSYLNYPEQSLPKKEENEIKKYKDNWNNWFVNVITFNYTRTFEKLINNKEVFEIIRLNSKKTYFQGIKHIHGYIDKDMVLGVNDISQIGNKEFRKKSMILNSFVKSNCNNVIKHTIDEQCENEIEIANLICIFGSSIGLTDKIWWEKVGNQLKRDCILIIFYRSNEPISERRSFEKEFIREEVKRDFLDKTTLSDEEKESVKNKIYVGVNTELFSDILTK